MKHCRTLFSKPKVTRKFNRVLFAKAKSGWVSKMDFSLGLVGAGNMGGALLRGWLKQGLDPAKTHVLDPSPAQAIASFLTETGVQHYHTASQMPSCDVLVLAVKPQMMGEVLPLLSGVPAPEGMAISVAAGTMLETLEMAFPAKACVRVMPNTPCLVGRGVSVACANGVTNNMQRQQVAGLMEAVGVFHWVEEEGLMHGVTALSGSGPAYTFYLAECMAEAGVKLGLPEELAATLARHTVSGAGELLFQSKEEIAELRKDVTSPGGTTAAALSVFMEQPGLKNLVYRAMEAAADRSMALSKE